MQEAMRDDPIVLDHEVVKNGSIDALPFLENLQFFNHPTPFDDPTDYSFDMYFRDSN